MPTTKSLRCVPCQVTRQPTVITGFVGDLDLDAWDGSGPVNLRPEFDSGATYQVPTEVGDWPDDDPNLKTGPAGTFGVLCGNWGGLRKSRSTKVRIWMGCFFLSV